MAFLLTVLKIIAIIIAAIIVLILLILMLRAHIIAEYSSDGNKISFFFKILFLKFGGDIGKEKPEEEKKKKPGKASAFLKRLFGLDKLEGESIKSNVAEDGVSKTSKELATVIYFIAGKLVWLLERTTLEAFKIHAVCGGDDDAADTAMEYGLACAVIYPLSGYIENLIKTKESGKDISVVCDFNAKSSIEAEISLSVRIIHAVRAFLKSVAERAEAEAGGSNE